jgi:sec-independent protein translocase protein TatC
MRSVVAGYMMFIIGTLLNYFIIFPVTLHFLGTYQVSGEISNMLTLQSYIDTFLTMSLLMGIIFELPVITWVLSLLGILRREYMQRYRRHAIVAILIVAAIITPTTDIMTLLIVSLPIWLLYELSILLCKR